MAGDCKVPLTQDELKHLEKVIVELEKKTSGEIRLMIVQRSVHGARVFPTLFSVLTAVSFMTIWLERHLLIWVADWWLVPALLGACAAVAWLLSRWPFMVRLMTPNASLREGALRRAELEFYREGLGNTKDGTGILLFLSMLEHQTVVLADKGIAGKLDSNVWNEVVQTMLLGPKTGRWVESLEKALRQAGALLAAHFPAKPGDHDELSNLVIVKL